MASTTIGAIVQLFTDIKTALTNILAKFTDGNHVIKKIVDTVPVSLSDRIVAAASTLQNAASATGNGSVYTNSGGSKKVTVELKGTSTSRTWVFEMAGPSGTYVAAKGFNVNTWDTAISSNGGSNAAPESWEFTVPPGWSLRTRLSAIAGGNATATAYPEVA